MLTGMSSQGPAAPPPAAHDAYGFPVAARGPRPEAKVGAVMLMVAGALQILGALLPWYQGAGVTANGFDEFPTPEGNVLQSPGRVWVAIGLVLFGLGLVTYIRRRIVAVGVTALVVATIGLFTSLLGVGAARNMRDLTYGGQGGPATGAFVGIISIVVAIAGAVQVLSRRRR